MKFFSGFSLKNDESFFKEYTKESEYCVSGFSYGAIKAFKYAQSQLSMGKRVDTLQLFSPAFFQSKSDKFKRLQTMSYKKNEDKYLNDFIRGCFFPYADLPTHHIETKIEELEELLNYEWIISELESLTKKGVEIEVYLGGEDKIIDVASAKELFLEVASVTYIKSANHFLQR